MSQVKWIKITTNIFDDEKIKLIESMPDSDMIIVIWFKLLALAGRSNSEGLVLLSDNVPYTVDMLEIVFRRKKSTIKLALKTFQEFGMIQIQDDTIMISNWSKHQNVKGLDKIKEQNRIRQQHYRDKQKQKRLELDKDIDKDIESNVTNNVTHIPYKEIVSYLNEKTNSKYKSTTSKTKTLIKARFNEGFTTNDFKKVIDIKSNEWLNDKDMKKYLRPETLFGTKFESYLNQEYIENVVDEYEEALKNY